MKLMRVLLLNRDKFVKGLENIRQNLQGFIDMKRQLGIKSKGSNSDD